MFSTGHLIWIGISMALIVIGFVLCCHYRPSLKKMFLVCFALGILSEIIKVLYTTEIVPMLDPVIIDQNGVSTLGWIPSGQYTPYLPLEHLPLELCSLYLVFMPAGILIKNERWKKWLYALMFTSGLLGGLMGIFLASIASDFPTVKEFFTSIRAWQFFLYHAMIVTESLYIGFGEESGLRFADWKKAAICLIALDMPTFYLNSVFSSEVYVNNKIAGVTHRINFFSSYVNPLGLILTEKWQWLLYLVIRAALAFILVISLYALLNLKRKTEKRLTDNK